MPVRYSLKRIAAAVIGQPELGNLDRRLLMSLCLGGGLVGVAATYENYLIGAGPVMVVTSGFQAGVLFSGYFLVRFLGIFKQIVWPIQLFLLSLLSFQWFLNAGSTGGAQYFFLICGLIGTIILDGWQRYLIAFVYVVAINAVILIEFLYPTLVVDYPTRDSRFADVSFSYTVCFVIAAVLTAFLAGHYREVVRHLQRYRAEFFEDLHLARIIQEEVFTHDPLQLAGFDVSITYKPSSELSGDLYEVTRFESGVLRILLADVKGHGINAALSAMLAKSEWRHSGHETMACAPALQAFNRQIMERYPRSLVLSACLVDIGPDAVEYASAGHLEQFIVSSGELSVLSASGIPMGLFHETRYSSGRIDWTTGSQLFLFTDALCEETDRSGQPAGFEWMKDVVRHAFPSSTAAADRILARFKAITGHEPGQTADDLTLIVVTKL